MKRDNWQRLTGLAMGIAFALALIMVGSYIMNATDEAEIHAPAASMSRS